MPLTKPDMNDGRLGVFMLPQERDPEKARIVLERVPLLESAVRMPSESEAQAVKDGGQT